MGRIVAIIPARGGSRRLPRKNLAEFCGTTLLANKIRQLKNVERLDGIVVSSDSDEILSVAEEEGAECHRRRSEFCDEKSRSFGEVVASVCSEVSCDHVMWSPCTSPLMDENSYSRAIEMYLDKVPSEGDSLTSFEETRRFYWDKNGPLNYRTGTEQPPSQELPPIFIWTAGVSLARREDMISWKYLFGPCPVKLIVGKRESVDIDDDLDLAKAQAWSMIDR